VKLSRGPDRAKQCPDGIGVSRKARAFGEESHTHREREHNAKPQHPKSRLVPLGRIAQVDVSVQSCPVVQDPGPIVDSIRASAMARMTVQGA
jgi:coenzyme F420-reducing hydrogenase gamma subunit